MTVRGSQKRALIIDNLRFAKRYLAESLSPELRARLRDLSCISSFSLKAGDLLLVGGSWYVTHTGLLKLARRKKCRGIHVEAIESLCDPTAKRFVLKATAFPCKSSLGFVGYGDADPSNVSPLVHGAEMRVAETRAVNRALRKAYGIGTCSAEEIGSNSSSAERIPPKSANGNGNSSGPKVRDRLCQIIRQHNLDAELVKAYAIDYCGTMTLRDANREQVENFVRELAEWAEKDRNGLQCQLNSYATTKPEEAA
jgi:hypothetical protein